MSARIIAVVLLLALQVQALAAVVLPCRHADLGTFDRPVHPCHLASPANTGDDDPADGPFDCQVCTLASIAGVFAPQARLAPFPPAGRSTDALPDRHFYRFFPEHPQRPPIRPVA